MSVAKHYTEWPKEDKDALAHQRMEEMAKKNEEIKRRHAEVEADRRKAEQQNSSVTLAIRGRSPPRDQGYKFLDDSSRTRAGGYEDCHEGPRRNSNSGGKDFRNARQVMAPRKPQEKEFSRGSSMSEKERDDYEKWKAEREKIDEERIARHKGKREWDEGKMEQEPEHKPAPSSKFYREPSWVSKQDDWPQRRDFSQRGHYQGNDRNVKNTRQNYEYEDPSFRDKSFKSFGRSRNTDFSSNRQSRASLSDEEDNRSDGRQQKFDHPNNHYPGFRKNQDGFSNYNSRARGRGGGFSQAVRSEYRSNVNSLENENSPSPKGLNNTVSNPTHATRVYNSSDNFTDNRKDSQDGYKNRLQENDYSHSKPRVKQSSGTWSDDNDTDIKTSAQSSAQKSDSSRTKQNSDAWCDDDDCSANMKTNSRGPSHRSDGSFGKLRKKNNGSWSDDDDDNTCQKNVRLPAQKNDSSFSKPKPKQSSGGTWSDDDSCANIKTNPRKSSQRNNSVFSKTDSEQTGGTWSVDDNANFKGLVRQCSETKSSSVSSKDHVSSGTWSDLDEDNSTGKSKNVDEAWVDSRYKSESYGSKCADYVEKSRKFAGNQSLKSFPGGRGRKWSFESSRQYSSEVRNISCDDYGDPKNESRAVKVGRDDSLTVSVGNASNDVKGNRSFPQRSTRNDRSYYKTAERMPEVLSRSLSDPDKHEIKHDASGFRRRFDDSHEYQQNARNFRFRGSGLTRGTFGRNSFQRNSFEDPLPQNQYNHDKSSQRREYPSVTEERSQNKFRDRERGGFQSSRNRGTRRFEETRRSVENRAMQNKSNKSRQNEGPVEDWGETTKGDVAVTVHAEDIWGDIEGSETANLDSEWTTDDTDKGQNLKSEGKSGDGWEAEDITRSNCHASEKQPDDDGWKSEDFNHRQVRDGDNQNGSVRNTGNKNQDSQDRWESRENASVADIKRTIHQKNQSPCHECLSNPDCACDESHDDSSWVTTSGDEFEEEVGEGEFIDDDEGLHISTMQQYDGDDSSSPEPNIPPFVCSLTEFLNRSKAVKAYDSKDETEIGEVHDASESKNVANSASCSPVHKLENLEETESLLFPKQNSECSKSLKDENSSRMETSLKPDSIDTARSGTESDVMASGIKKCQDDGEQFLVLSDMHCDKRSEREVSETNNCENVQHFSVGGGSQNVMPETQLTSELLSTREIHDPVHKLGNSEKTESLLFHKLNFEHNELLKDERSTVQPDSSDTTGSITDSDIKASGTDNGEIHHPIVTDDNCKAPCDQDKSLLNLETICETADELEQKNISSSSTTVTGDHSQNGNVAACCEVLHDSGVDDNVLDLKSFTENLQQNSSVANDSPDSAVSLSNEIICSADIKCSSSTSEDLGESRAFQNTCSLKNFDGQSGGVCSISSDFIKPNDGYRRTDMSFEENNSSELVCNKQEHESVSECSGVPESGLSASDKAAMEDESAFPLQLADCISSVIIESRTTIQSEDVEPTKSMPVEHSECSVVPESGLSVNDKAEIEDDIALPVQLADCIPSVMIQSRTTLPSEDVEPSKSVPVEHSCVTADAAENDL